MYDASLVHAEVNAHVRINVSEGLYQVLLVGLEFYEDVNVIAIYNK